MPAPRVLSRNFSKIGISFRNLASLNREDQSFYNMSIASDSNDSDNSHDENDKFNQINKFKNALLSATKKGDITAVKVQIASGANVNEVDEVGFIYSMLTAEFLKLVFIRMVALLWFVLHIMDTRISYHCSLEMVLISIIVNLLVYVSFNMI